MVHCAEKSININMDGGWRVYLSEIKGNNRKGNFNVAKTHGHHIRGNQLVIT